MSLVLYNTLSRKKEPFQPIDPKNVRMYVCGPTVYDLAHIGNARPIIVFDVLFRLLRHIYGEAHVTYARNITDVDDKINNRAVERWPDMDPIAAIRRLTEETTAQFHKDIAGLGVLEPTVEPRATDHIEGMKRLCQALVAKGHAYVAEEHVLFDAGSMKDYGRLANRSLEEMEAGARVDVAPYKRGPMDFVLWKPSTKAQPGWVSPCGIATPGRPGWHIECSAMSEQHLGPVFDIHGGGIDLVFPHHENELAQSRCAHGTPVMANVWMHNGFLQVEGEKMSKSLGNFITINELYDGWRGHSWNGRIVRLTMLRTHYRQPIDWSVELLAQSRTELNNWFAVIQKTYGHFSKFDEGDYCGDVVEALSDDLNTPEAITALRRLARRDDQTSARQLLWGLRFLALLNFERPLATLGGFYTDENVPDTLQLSVHSHAERLSTALANGAIDTATSIIGELQKSNIAVYEGEGGRPELTILDPAKLEDNDKIAELIAARLDARKRKDFKESDRIRDELAAMGIALKDSKNKATGEIETTWEVRASGTTEVKR